MHDDRSFRIYSLSAASREYHLTKPRIRKLIQDGTLPATRIGRKYQILGADILPIAIEAIRTRATRIRISPAYVPPVLKRYHRFHRIIDEFTWLLKAYYSLPTELKKKNFRLDELYQRFIVEAAANSRKQ